uniref:Uncharacterized protein n=1 Tax=Anopheles coluzzii TaxID=1518534 RepID=A0A8W7P0S9_ANOCL
MLNTPCRIATWNACQEPYPSIVFTGYCTAEEDTDARKPRAKFAEEFVNQPLTTDRGFSFQHNVEPELSGGESAEHESSAAALPFANANAKQQHPIRTGVRYDLLGRSFAVELSAVTAVVLVVLVWNARERKLPDRWLPEASWLALRVGVLGRQGSVHAARTGTSSTLNDHYCGE